jgi:purine nucleosidase
VVYLPTEPGWPKPDREPRLFGGIVVAVNQKHIVLDTDIGTDSDDALALALAISPAAISLDAVVATGKDPRLRARIAKKLLNLGGSPDVPVHIGEGEPLGDGNLYLFGHEGQGILTDGEELSLEHASGVEAYRQLASSDAPLEIVAIGSMTTLARALDQIPHLADKIGHLWIMGGHLRPTIYGGHEFAAGIDYNLVSDPTASIRVLQSGVPITLVPAAVTLQTWITAGDVDALAATPTPMAETLVAAIRTWAPMQKGIFGGLGAEYDDSNMDFLHDPLTLACCIDESFCEFEDMEIEVSVVDGILQMHESQNAQDSIALRCAVSVDAERFHDYFIENLDALIARTDIAGG